MRERKQTNKKTWTKPTKQSKTHNKTKKRTPPYHHHPQKKKLQTQQQKKPKPHVPWKIQCGYCIFGVRCCSLSSVADCVSTAANSMSCSLPAAGYSWAPHCWALWACCHVCCDTDKFLSLRILGFHFSDAFRSVKGSAGVGQIVHLSIMSL